MREFCLCIYNRVYSLLSEIDLVRRRFAYSDEDEESEDLDDCDDELELDCFLLREDGLPLPLPLSFLGFYYFT